MAKKSKAKSTSTSSATLAYQPKESKAAPLRSTKSDSGASEEPQPIKDESKTILPSEAQPSDTNPPGVLELELDWHDAQASVFESGIRFIVLFCGRRWGKTRGAILWLVMRTLSGRNRLGWWVSPTYRQAKVAWRYFFLLFRRSGIIRSFNRSDLTVYLVMGCRIEFRSAEIPDNLRGEGVNSLVMDEFASMAPSTWQEVLRPVLIDTKGDAVFIGTPKGMNWASTLFFRAQSGDDPEWMAWQFSTYSNPYIDANELKKVEAETPESVVRQEIYAEPMENADAVFRNIDELSTAEPQTPIAGQYYQMGVDLAKYKDFTVIAVFLGKTQVYLERFNKIDWDLQERRIEQVAIRYNQAQVVVDSTGVGDVVYERLKRRGLHITPFQITASTKPELIDTLSIRCDKKELKLLNDATQKSELKAYAYELTKGGRLRTNAPSGLHDDTVIAVALATFNEPRRATEHVLVNKPRKRNED